MIYLDHHAATPLSKGARAAMADADDAWANPSSVHRAGQRARAVLDRARGRIAAAVARPAGEVVLTSGGTEAVNLAVRGLAGTVRRVVTTGLAHPALAEAVACLGVPTAYLQVLGGRAPTDGEVASLLGEGALLAVTWVNHETGTVLPVARWGALARQAGALMAVDGCQALGKVEVEAGAALATTLALGAHKVGGPAGAGAVVVAKGTDLGLLLRGGGQERGRRPGSPDVAAAAGFGGACLDLPERLQRQAGIGILRDRLEAHLTARGARVNGAEGPRTATVTNVSIAGARSDTLIAALDIEGVCAASGAACSSGVVDASKVVAAMYPGDADRSRTTLRLSLGPETTEADVDGALERLDRVLDRFE
ncbi:MAG: aminotransferase class V-fold PLP-dependent enzyme [Deltaproteobacteria bacterium]|nr:aminotransferase class V-fold PLP-dependent enzyme [Deltaproteobacteria bacterium]